MSYVKYHLGYVLPARSEKDWVEHEDCISENEDCYSSGRLPTLQDAALAAQNTAMANLVAELNRNKDPEDLPFVIGHYVGSFDRGRSSEDQGQVIDLGFQPRWVCVYRCAGIHFCCATPGMPAYWNMFRKSSPLLEVLPNGFRVFGYPEQPVGYLEPAVNRQGVPYGYIALK